MRAPTNSSMSCAGLWDCWEDGAIVADKATGQYIDAGKVRPLNHKGRFFQVTGPINMARCPQGHPVIIQAGGSPSGLELAARTADVVFSVVQELAPRQGRLRRSQGAHGQIRPRAGRDRGAARRDADHRRQRCRGAREAGEAAKLDHARPTRSTLVASRIGYDVSGHPLDGPVPPPPPAQGSRTFSSVLYEMARRENMTLRDLYNLTAAARGHWVLCGTPHTHRRHAGGMVRRARGRWVQHPAGAISPARSPISSISWCRNCSAAGCSAATTRARHCATISAFPVCLRRRCARRRLCDRPRCKCWCGKSHADNLTPPDRTGAKAVQDQGDVDRQKVPTAERFGFAGMLLDIGAHSLTDEVGGDLQLTPAEFKLLAALVRGAGRAFCATI